MQTLTVKNIEEKHTKDGSKSFFIITDNTGASFSLWEPIGMIKPGCILEADIEVKGKYANIKDFKITSQPTVTKAPPSQSRPTYGQDSPEKRRSMALSYAKDLYVAGKILNKADFMESTLDFDYFMEHGAWPQTPTSTPEKQSTASVKADPPSPAPKQAQTVPKITPESVYENIKKLLTGKDGEVGAAELRKIFEGVGALGETAMPKLKSLSQENLLVVSGRVNQALLAAKAEGLFE